MMQCLLEIYCVSGMALGELFHSSRPTPQSTMNPVFSQRTPASRVATWGMDKEPNERPERTTQTPNGRRLGTPARRPGIALAPLAAPLGREACGEGFPVG